MSSPDPAADVDQERNTHRQDEHRGSTVFLQTVEHICMPPKVPQIGVSVELEYKIALKMCQLVENAAMDYAKTQRGRKTAFWKSISKSLKYLGNYVQGPLQANQVEKSLRNLHIGDAFVFHLRAQNAALVMRKGPENTTFEAFESQASADIVYAEAGKFTQTFPGSAVSVPNTIAGSRSFAPGLAQFLARLDTAQEGEPLEAGETPHPRFVTELFMGLLRGLGQTVHVSRVQKRIADEVFQHEGQKMWRRHPLWLVIRVFLQTTVASRDAYKTFMVFFHAHLLSALFQQEFKIDLARFNDDLIFVMRAKLARRIYKIRASDEVRNVLTMVNNAAKKAEDLLQQRWKARLSAHTKNKIRWDPEKLDLANDLTLTLNHSRKFLRDILGAHENAIETERTEPAAIRRIRTDNFKQYESGKLEGIYLETGWVALADFETSVSHNLDHFLRVNLVDSNVHLRACEILLSCLTQYSAIIKTAYTLDPLDQSIAVLTMLRLWTAIDQFATTALPMLGDYSPEIPERFMSPLLLRSGDHIRQSIAIEAHIRQRYSEANLGTSLFTNDINSDSFSCRYYAESVPLQEVHKMIVTDAQLARKQKLRDMERVNQDYHYRKAMVDQLEHVYYRSKRKADADKNIMKHSKACKTCKELVAINNMKIPVFEDPLPDDEYHAQNVVFELRCPPIFALWRSATYLVMSDVGLPDRGLSTAKTTLSSHKVLSEYLLEPSGARITLGSTVKPLEERSEGMVSVPATEDQMYSKNKMNLVLYDTERGAWASGPFKDANIIRHGTLQITEPQSQYLHLQYALERTDHSTNQVIVDQSECPQTMSLHEHIAFGSLRAGPRLQWMSILRELSSNALTLRRDEVYTLMCQAAWQIGELTNDQRSWHLDLSNEQFGLRLVEVCSAVCETSKMNWLEAGSMKVLMTLVTRLIAGSESEDVKDAACILIRQARKIGHDWLLSIKKSISATTNKDKDAEQQILLFEISALIRTTYDIDSAYLERVLDTNEDVLMLMEAGLALKENQPAKLSSAPIRLQLLHRRDQRLSHKLEISLRSLLERNWDAFDYALRSVWPNYRPNGTHEVSVETGWISCTTLATEGRRTQYVDYNLLEGTLLVNGAALGRLPDDITNHATYIRVFGQKILDVIPSDVVGMDYSSRLLVHGYQVSFLLNAQGLRIQARSEEACLELIPHGIFKGDMPLVLTEDYVQWLDVNDHIVYFRPLQDQWRTEATHWQLCMANDSTLLPARMFKTNGAELTSTSLIDVYSKTHQMLSSQVLHLELPDRIFITYCHSDDAPVSLELPRYRLQFRLKDGLLESMNLRGYVIDQNQFAGCFLGLYHQLVLCIQDSLQRSLPRSRCVLVPYGTLVHVPSYLKSENVDMDWWTVDLAEQKRIIYHKFVIDEDMGALIPQASLTSRLYKIYLHAVTGQCVLDPLTSRTGTEMAIEELLSGAVRSFQSLEPADLQLLALIGGLTPRQDAHNHGQVIHWTNTLRSLSQHYGFSTAVVDILQHAQSLQVFQNSDVQMKIDQSANKLKRNPLLLRRTAARTSLFWPMDITTRLSSKRFSSKVEDFVYVSRDRLQGSASQAASWAAQLCQTKNPFSPVNLTQRILQDARGPRVNATDENSVMLGFHRHWLSPNLLTDWLSLYETCRFTRDHHYAILFSLSTLAYGSPELRDLVPVLHAVTKNPGCFDREAPRGEPFKIEYGYQVRQHHVEQIIHERELPRSECPACPIPRPEDHNEDDEDGDDDEAYGGGYEECVEEWYRQQLRTHQESFVEVVMAADRTSAPYSAPPIAYTWFNVDSCLLALEDYRNDCARNRDLRTHLESVEIALNSHHPLPGTVINFEDAAWDEELEEPPSFPEGSVTSGVCLADLLTSSYPPNELHSRVNMADFFSMYSAQAALPSTDQLRHVLRELTSTAGNRVRQLYSEDLERSCTELEAQPPSRKPAVMPPFSDVKKYRDHMRQLWNSYLDEIKNSLFPPGNSVEGALLSAGLWPRMSPRILFDCLSFKRRSIMTPVWSPHFNVLCRLFMAYQASQRMLRYSLTQQAENFLDELETACNMTSTVNDVDHLLLQIDGDFCARSVQIRVAQEMVSPQSRRNSVLQLNMGQGKSSVIVPMICASLADGRTLARVVVLKALSKQMFTLLVLRLGNLLNRRIMYIPFSRQVKMDATRIATLKGMFESAALDGAVLLVQPEHLLSFKLMGIERLMSAPTPADEQAARMLIDLQEWLSSKSRTVMDESDEICHVQYQLIYTAGVQQSPDGHPERWTIIQQMLSLVVKHAQRIKEGHPDEIDIQERDNGGCPVVRFVRITHGKGGASTTLRKCLISDIFNGRIESVNVQHLTNEDRTVVAKFLTQRLVDEPLIARAKELCRGAWSGVLILRGLLAYDIISYCLRDKRYRVNYGLDPTRSMMAVPYSAKDMPSLRAEYSHMDVAIALTTLAYRYAGLTEVELRTSFNLLLQEDDPDAEYKAWTHDLNILPALQQLGGVNTKDVNQFREHIFPVFAYSVGAVDFYLSRVVFPKAAKEFTQKLSTSGWDLVEQGNNITTGFSGTNDRRYLLPTSIEQTDAIHQASTNALVLTHLMRPENDHYRLMTDGDGKRLDTKGFLDVLLAQTPPIRVLLDVGAQMLELQNQELVEHWLSLKPKGVAAAVFFKGDDLSVLTKDTHGWHVEAFESSPYSQELDRCIVYLDDAHTRGTDLKLPRDARAAVTLGPKVTKDRLVQGSMRMRLLGQGQSVMFFAPPECDGQIRGVRRATIAATDAIQIADIVRWVLLETCEDIQHYIPHWAEQGVSHARRSNALLEYRRSDEVGPLKQAWLVPEARTLEHMYGQKYDASELFKAAFDVPALRDRLNALGVAALSNPRMDEEQEREVSHEAEREREVYRPAKAEAIEPSLSKELVRFVKDGTLVKTSKHFLPMLQIVPELDSTVWSTRLFTTADFTNTVVGIFKAPLSTYVRPVNWILSSNRGYDTTLVAISPFEANALLPDIRNSKFVRLHVYRARVVQTTRSMSDLEFCAVPPIKPLDEQETTEVDGENEVDGQGYAKWMPPPRATVSQLNLFAGQLYLDDYETYVELAAFLGVACPESAHLYGRTDLPRSSDGFIEPALRTNTEALTQVLKDFNNKSFQVSSIEILKQLISVRRHGTDFIRTDMGQVLHGRQLTKATFRDRLLQNGPRGGPDDDRSWSMEHDDFLRAALEADDMEPTPVPEQMQVDHNQEQSFVLGRLLQHDQGRPRLGDVKPNPSAPSTPRRSRLGRPPQSPLTPRHIGDGTRTTDPSGPLRTPQMSRTHRAARLTSAEQLQIKPEPEEEMTLVPELQMLLAPELDPTPAPASAPELGHVPELVKLELTPDSPVPEPPAATAPPDVMGMGMDIDNENQQDQMNVDGTQDQTLVTDEVTVKPEEFTDADAERADAERNAEIARLEARLATLYSSQPVKTEPQPDPISIAGAFEHGKTYDFTDL